MIEHHIGIVVGNIEEDIETYSKLGYVTVSEIYYDEVQKNRIVFLKKDGTKILLELIEPMDSSSTVSSALLGYHHICYEVDNEKEFNVLFKSKGYGRIILHKVRAIALGNRFVSFAMLRNGSIIEYLHK